MKIQLIYDRPSQVSTDLLVVILDDQYTFHDVAGSPLEEMIRRVQRDIKDKRLKTEFFSPLDLKGGPRNLLVHSTALNKTHNLWETSKIFVSRSIRFAQDRGLDRIAVVLNTHDAVPFVGKAVEGAILGSYTFDRYRREKTDRSKLQLQIVGLKSQDERNKRALHRYTVVSNAVNEARDMINEPGAVVVPETMAEATSHAEKPTLSTAPASW